MTDVWEQPQPGRPRVSLLTSVTVVEEEDERWVNGGFEWRPLGCGEGGLYPVELCPSENVLTASDPITGGSDPVATPAFGVFATDRCSTFGFTAAEYERRARARLLATRDKWIERQLWEDPLGLGGPVLSGSGAAAVTSGGTTASRALRLLEQAASDCMDGEVVIHATPFVYGALVEAGLARLVNRDDHWFDEDLTRVVDYMGSLVVPGRGYTGTGPADQPVGATEWIYATGPLVVRLGQLELTPGTLAEATNRRTNTATFYAKQAAAVAFDPGCCVLAAEVTR
jgi:hypothetical protein